MISDELGFILEIRIDLRMSKRPHFPRPMTDGWPRIDSLSALMTYGLEGK
jgi:hypothetical protein